MKVTSISVIMKTRFFYHILLAGTFACLMAGCGGSGNKQTENAALHADTIYIGDLREKFKGDSLFFKVVAPDLILIQNQYTWASTEKEAQEKGLDTTYYRKVQEEIRNTNEAIRKGIMKGADPKRIYDFQKGK